MTEMIADKNNEEWLSYRAAKNGVSAYGTSRCKADCMYCKGALGVDVCWYYEGAKWSFSATHRRFVEWVDSGFPVVCIDCCDRNVFSARRCWHVVFPAGEQEKAQQTVNAIKMGLV